MATVLSHERTPSPAVVPIVAIAFLGGYILLDWVSYIHPLQEYGITPWNPQPALAIALLLWGGQRYLPLVFSAAAAGIWLVHGGHGGWESTAVVAAALGLGYGAIAAALCAGGRMGTAFADGRDVVRLVVIVSIGSLVTGILYISALLASRVGPLERPFEALARFWVGDAAGVLVTLPLLLMMLDPHRRSEIRRLAGQGETAIHAAVLVATVVAILVVPGEMLVRFFYVLFLPLIAVATRLGLVGATIAALCIQAALIANGEWSRQPAITFVELQALLIALTVTGLFLGIAVDERRRAVEELRRTMRLAAAGEMAAALAHELNQPLTATLSYARASLLVARKSPADPGMLEEVVRKVVAEASRAADVLRKIRDFFRTGAADLREVVLVDAANEAIALAKGRTATPIHLEAEATVGPVLADATQLGIVLRNLLDNAAQAAAGAAAPRIDLRIRRHEDGLLLQVEDNGPGIVAERAERIFEPFETSRATGMGMGLAVSRAIAEAHGGRLWAEAGGHGDVRLWLPFADARDRG